MTPPTDDQLKRLKERLGAMRPMHETKPSLSQGELSALLAHLEAAEKSLVRIHKRVANLSVPFDGLYDHCEGQKLGIFTCLQIIKKALITWRKLCRE